MSFVRDRAYRRWQAAKSKRRAYLFLKHIWCWGWEDPRVVGIWASVGCKPCSCSGCGNPRRHFSTLTRKEKQAALGDAEIEDDLRDQELSNYTYMSYASDDF